MTHNANPNRTVHEGRNIKRFREMLGIKQDALAIDLGEDWNQQRISLLEQKERIDVSLLQRISAALKVPLEAIQNFDEEQAINIISNTFDNGSIGYQKNDNCTFHPIDKLLQLHEEKITLYERMLKEKDDMMAILENLIKAK